MTENVKKPNAFERFFKIKERGSSIGAEVWAGILMFLEVICTMAVSSQIMAYNGGIPSFSTMYFGIMLVAVIGTMLVGVVCNAPVVQSVSMGSVVLIVTTLTTNLGMSLANVLMMALVANVIYLIVMLIKPARRFVFGAVPVQVKKALPAALGGYLLVYALTNLNVFSLNSTDYSDVLEGMAAAGDKIPFWGVNTLNFSASNAEYGGWYMTTAIVTALVAFAAMVILKALKVKRAGAWSLLAGLVTFAIMFVIRAHYADYYWYAFFTPAYGGMYFYDSTARISSEYQASLAGRVFSGFDFTQYTNYMNYLAGKNGETFEAGGKIVGIFITTVLSFLALGVSETGAGLHGAAYAGGITTEEGKTPFQSGSLVSKMGTVGDVYTVNAFTSVIGCILGSGPVAVRGESAVGTHEGGKTGLSSIVAGVLMIVAMFNLIFTAITIDGNIVMGILIFVALVLLTSFKNCDFTAPIDAIPFVVTVGAAALTQNLGTGILLGIACDTMIRLLQGKGKEIKPGAYLFSVVFLAVQIIALF